MKLVRCGEAPSARAPAQNFTGTVWQNPINRPPEPARAVSVWVTFEPGARTNCHTHPLGQTLHVTQGTGSFRTEGGERVTIRAGDTVWIPPGEKHWHGATDSTTNVSFNLSKSVYSAAWRDCPTAPSRRCLVECARVVDSSCLACRILRRRNRARRLQIYQSSHRCR